MWFTQFSLKYKWMDGEYKYYFCRCLLMQLTYHVELQRAANIAKGKMLPLVLFDLVLTGVFYRQPWYLLML